MQSGKQSHHEWYGLRFRPSTVVWTGEGVFKRMLLCVWFGPERAASQDDLKLGWKNWVSSAEDQGQTGIHRKKLWPSALSPLPTSTKWATWREKLATFYAKLHMYLAEATERGGGEEQEPGHQRSSCSLWQHGEQADLHPQVERQLAPCCVLVGVMALASPPPSKSHRNVFCGQLYLTQIVNR